MPLFNLPNATSGLDTIAVQTVSTVPAFIPLLLVFIFFVVLLGGSGRQKARTGYADFPMWAVIASLATFVTALILSTISGILLLDYLAYTIAMAVLCGIWFFLDHKQSEV